MKSALHKKFGFDFGLHPSAGTQTELNLNLKIQINGLY